MKKEKEYKIGDLAIHDWFLTNLPQMIEELKKDLDNYPPYFLTDYYHRIVEPLGVCTSDEFFDSFGTPESRKMVSKAQKACRKRWLHVLHIIEEACINSKRETCIYENVYQEEFRKAFKENFKKYGLKINELADEEYKKISRLYFNEEEHIDMLLEHNKKNVLRLFVKYFDYL